MTDFRQDVVKGMTDRLYQSMALALNAESVTLGEFNAAISAAVAQYIGSMGDSRGYDGQQILMLSAIIAQNIVNVSLWALPDTETLQSQVQIVRKSD